MQSRSSQLRNISEVRALACRTYLSSPSKFHCELNWIACYWGPCKNFTRKQCNCTPAGTVAQVPPWLMVFMLTTGVRIIGGSSGPRTSRKAPNLQDLLRTQRTQGLQEECGVSRYAVQNSGVQKPPSGTVGCVDDVVRAMHLLS